ncbi:MAG: type transport system permease protein [Mycobacteriales bacterium]|jgi:ABC-2 type transport system permease protein
MTAGATPVAVAPLRLVVRCWLAHLKYLMSSGFFVAVSSVQPVIFATIAFYLFRAGDRPTSLVYAAIGAGMLNLWSTTLIGSGQALTLLRTAGLLELLVAAPAPFVLVLAPITVATATVGLYAMVATLLWGWLLFDIPLHIEHPLLLVLAVPVTVFGLGMLGTVLASVFVRFRYANALTNLFDYPVWLISGMLVPVDLLPHWARPLSWPLPSTWGVRAVRDSVLGGRPLTAIGICFALGVGYLGLGVLTVRTFELAARRHASLALA